MNFMKFSILFLFSLIIFACSSDSSTTNQIDNSYGGFFGGFFWLDAYNFSIIHASHIFSGIKPIRIKKLNT